MNKEFLLISIVLSICTAVACSAVPSTSKESREPKASPTVVQVSKLATSTETVETEKVETIFDPSTAKRLPPKDVLKEITYFGGGGGVYCTGAEQNPTITYEPQDEELMTLSTMVACGWESGEALKGTIIFPNGKGTTQLIKTEMDEGVYYGMLGIKPTIDDPQGNYTFILEGKKGKVETQAYFSNPNGSRLFQSDENELFLYGFKPQERVRLFLYGNDAKLLGWQEYKANQDGQLTIRYSGGPYRLIAAIGDLSGETHLREIDPWGRSIDPLYGKTIQALYRGGMQSRLTLSFTAQVAFTDGSDIRIRAEPGLKQTVLHKVPEGTTVILEEGPKCVDEIFWWKVKVDNQWSGWMAEFSDGVYFLEPF